MIIELGLASEATKGDLRGEIVELSLATGLPCNSPVSFNATLVVVPGCRI